MQKLKKIPHFKNEDEEFEFWSTHDTTEYFDLSKAKRAIFPNLNQEVQTISLRLPKTVIMWFKQLASAQDVPYQSLMKTYLWNSMSPQKLSFTKAVRKKKKTGRSASRSATD